LEDPRGSDISLPVEFLGVPDVGCNSCLLIPMVIQTLQAGAHSGGMTWGVGFGHRVSQGGYC